MALRGPRRDLSSKIAIRPSIRGSQVDGFAYFVGLGAILFRGWISPVKQLDNSDSPDSNVDDSIRSLVLLGQGRHRDRSCAPQGGTPVDFEYRDLSSSASQRGATLSAEAFGIDARLLTVDWLGRMARVNVPFGALPMGSVLHVACSACCCCFTRIFSSTCSIFRLTTSS